MTITRRRALLGMLAAPVVAGLPELPARQVMAGMDFGAGESVSFVMMVDGRIVSAYSLPAECVAEIERIRLELERAYCDALMSIGAPADTGSA